jgi:hypothetical protein
MLKNSYIYSPTLCVTVGHSYAIPVLLQRMKENKVGWRGNDAII